MSFFAFMSKPDSISFQTLRFIRIESAMMYCLRRRSSPVHHSEAQLRLFAFIDNSVILSSVHAGFVRSISSKTGLFSVEHWLLNKRHSM